MTVLLGLPQLRQGARRPVRLCSQPAVDPGAAAREAGIDGRARALDGEHCRLLAVRKLIGEAHKNGMLGSEEAEHLSESLSFLSGARPEQSN